MSYLCPGIVCPGALIRPAGFTGSEVRRSHHFVASRRTHVPAVSSVLLLLMVVLMRSGVGVDRGVMPRRQTAATPLVLLGDHAQHVRISRVERLDRSLPVTGYPTHSTSQLTLLSSL